MQLNHRFVLTLLVVLVTLAGVAGAAETPSDNSILEQAKELLNKIKGAQPDAAKSPDGSESSKTPAAGKPEKTPAAGAQTAADELPKADPCKLLTTAEVRKIFPDAENGKRETSTDEYGIKSCIWNHPRGRLGLQVMKGEPGTVKHEIQGWSIGFKDPLKPGVKVRYETIAGVGDEAMAVVERADEKAGILQDAAMLIAQRGDQQINLFSNDLASRDRSAALKALEDLGKAAAKRL